MDEPKGGGPPPDEHEPYNYPDDPYYTGVPEPPAPEFVKPPEPSKTPDEKAVIPATAAGGGGSRTPPPPPPPDDEGDGEEEGMLRMSFLEHLEELRTRIVRALWGFGVVFLVCIVFCNELWRVIQAPATDALHKIGIKDGKLVILSPMEGFMIIWVWTPVVASIFLASPWILYQVWAFIAPGLYRRERRWAIPFVVCTAGLFILGGCFAYFIAFRFGLAFLLGLGLTVDVVPVVSIDHYFDLFVNVMLGVSLVFEMPVVIFFLVLLRLVTPKFLLEHSRYAILAIVIIAAVVTPTPDAVNMMIFAVPMCALYFVGVFAGYLLVMRREGRRFPWAKFLRWLALAVAIVGGALYIAMVKYHLHFIRHWPFLAK